MELLWQFCVEFFQKILWKLLQDLHKKYLLKESPLREKLKKEFM